MTRAVDVIGLPDKCPPLGCTPARARRGREILPFVDSMPVGIENLRSENDQPLVPGVRIPKPSPKIPVARTRVAGRASHQPADPSKPPMSFRERDRIPQ